MKTINTNLFEFKIYNNKILIYDILENITIDINGNDYVELKKVLQNEFTYKQ